MTLSLKNVALFLVALFISALFVWKISTDIKISKLVDGMMKADFSWVIAAVVISLLSNLSRAARWNILMEPLGHKPPLQRTFIAVMVGYFGNILLPRLGEVLRCAVLNRTDRVSMDSGFGTVVVERAFDFVCLLSLIGLSLMLEYDRFLKLLQSLLTGPSVPFYQKPLFWIAVAGVIGCILAFIFKQRIMKSNFYKKIGEFLKGILEGIISVRKIKRKKEFFFHTIFIWICYYLMTYLVFFSLEETSALGPVAGLVMLIVGGLGMSAPSSGGIGVFHLFVGEGLHLFYGLNPKDGYTYAGVVHSSQFLSILLVGGICTIIALYLIRKIAKTNDLGQDKI